MKSLFSKILIIAIIFSIISPSASAHSSKNHKNRYQQSYQTPTPQYNYSYQSQPQYQYYTNPPVISCTNLSNVSVGVGNLSNGVNIVIDSNNATLQSCIKNTYWLNYFTRFGNSVNVNISNTTLGVQIMATSNEITAITSLQNAGWISLITGVSSYNYNNNYSYNQNYNYQYNYAPQPYTYIPSYTNTPYRTGTSVFGNTSQIARYVYNTSNGIQMNFTSGDYNTMNFLQ